VTAIAGIVENGKVWMGGDSAATDGWLRQCILADPKVFVNKDFLIGNTGSVRIMQLLEHEFSPPTPHEGECGMAYMVKRFIPAVKSVLSSGGCERTLNGVAVGS
jgi:hypothetical protein